MNVRVGTLLAGAGIVIGAVGTQASQVMTEQPESVRIVQVSTPKPSGYCSKKEIGQRKWYRSPSGRTAYWVKCMKTTTQKWRKA